MTTQERPQRLETGAAAGEPAIAVLLSAYNGERFIEAQIQSIIEQTHRRWHLFIRDDGSTDGTHQILAHYAELDDRISVYREPNVGVVASFMSLLETAGDDFELYAFCDQDDVWVPEKLTRTAAHTIPNGASVPTMYCSRLSYVDEQLEPIGQSKIPNEISFSNAIVENIATGCTVAIDGALRQRVLAGDPGDMVMHDWWCYLVATAFGRVVFDPECTVLYRQHGANVVGATASFSKQMFRRAKRFLGRRSQSWPLSEQAARFIAKYDDELPQDARAIARRFVESKAGLRQRAVYALSMDARRNTRVDNTLLRLMILANRY
ncbi:MAG: glycosyltransferase family 2 protein [Pseudomonadota bacterium]